MSGVGGRSGQFRFKMGILDIDILENKKIGQWKTVQANKNWRSVSLEFTPSKKMITILGFMGGPDDLQLEQS